jgi:two-component system, NarL family, sensor kinase
MARIAGRRSAAAGAGALACFAGLLAVAGVVLHVVPGRLDGGEYGSWWITNAIGALAVAIPAGMVAAKRRHNPVGWLLLALAFGHGLTVAAREYSLHALAPRSGLPAGTAALWLSGWTYNDFPLLIALFFLFPDGRLPSRNWRAALAVGLGISLVTTVWLATAPGPMLDAGPVVAVNPLGWAAFYDPIAGLGLTILFINAAVLAAGVGLLLKRAGSAVGPERRQIMLVTVSAVLLTAELVHEDGWSYSGEEYVGAVMLVLLAITVAVAILRYGLYEIDFVISRTAVYGGLTLILGGAYLGAVAGTGLIIHGRGLGAIPAAILVALLIAPARARLQRASDRLLFGEREDPYAVISSVSQQLDAGDPGRVLPALASTVAQTLKLPYVSIELDRDGGRELVAEHGRLRGEPTRLPLVYGGQDIGRIRLGRRTAGERFTPAELRLFGDIARQVAIAAHAVRLGEDLRHSSGQLVHAREEERRRVRRDLHDGLGPTLAGISMQIASARLLLARDPAAADELLGQLIDETKTAIAEIRRLVYALRPAALDELGLISALRMQAERFPGLDVSVHARDDVQDLPAAVEVAAYRIATEALTNVSRHAAATACTIAISTNGHLEIEILDDGQGMHSEWRPGVGLTSIHERAHELGGSCVVADAEHGGTRVFARLPLPSAG